MKQVEPYKIGTRINSDLGRGSIRSYSLDSFGFKQAHIALDHEVSSGMDSDHVFELEAIWPESNSGDLGEALQHVHEAMMKTTAGKNQYHVSRSSRKTLCGLPITKDLNVVDEVGSGPTSTPMCKACERELDRLEDIELEASEKCPQCSGTKLVMKDGCPTCPDCSWGELPVESARTVYEVGDTIKFTEFAYTNKAGGTGSAGKNPITDLDHSFDGVASGKVVKTWDDYETGQIYHVKLDPKTFAQIKDKAQDDIAYVSEFDLADTKKQAEAVCELCKKPAESLDDAGYCFDCASGESTQRAKEVLPPSAFVPKKEAATEADEVEDISSDFMNWIGGETLSEPVITETELKEHISKYLQEYGHRYPDIDKEGRDLFEYAKEFLNNHDFVVVQGGYELIEAFLEQNPEAANVLNVLEQYYQEYEADPSARTAEGAAQFSKHHPLGHEAGYYVELFRTFLQEHIQDRREQGDELLDGRASLKQASYKAQEKIGDVAQVEIYEYPDLLDIRWWYVNDLVDLDIGLLLPELESTINQLLNQFKTVEPITGNSAMFKVESVSEAQELFSSLVSVFKKYQADLEALSEQLHYQNARDKMDQSKRRVDNLREKYPYAESSLKQAAEIAPEVKEQCEDFIGEIKKALETGRLPEIFYNEPTEDTPEDDFIFDIYTHMVVYWSEEEIAQMNEYLLQNYSDVLKAFDEKFGAQALSVVEGKEWISHKSSLKQATPFDRFERGTGKYKCEACGKLTRNTGDEGGCMLCKACYDYCCWENTHSDNDHETDPDPKCLVCQGVPAPYEKRASLTEKAPQWKCQDCGWKGDYPSEIMGAEVCPECSMDIVKQAQDRLSLKKRWERKLTDLENRLEDAGEPADRAQIQEDIKGVEKQLTELKKWKPSKKEASLDQLVPADAWYSKPTAWYDVPELSFTIDDPELADEILKLPVIHIEGEPLDDFREATPQYFVAENNNEHYLVDTQGYKYARYVIRLPDFDLMKSSLDKEADDMGIKPDVEVPMGNKMVLDNNTRKWKVVPDTTPTTEVTTSSFRVGDTFAIEGGKVDREGTVVSIDEYSIKAYFDGNIHDIPLTKQATELCKDCGKAPITDRDPHKELCDRCFKEENRAAGAEEKFNERHDVYSSVDVEASPVKSIEESEDDDLYCKCGGVLYNKLVGEDDYVLKCGDCGRTWPDEEPWMKKADNEWLLIEGDKVRFDLEGSQGDYGASDEEWAQIIAHNGQEARVTAINVQYDTPSEPEYVTIEFADGYEIEAADAKTLTKIA